MNINAHTYTHAYQGSAGDSAFVEMVELEFKLNNRQYVSHRFYAKERDPAAVVYQLRK